MSSDINEETLLSDCLDNYIMDNYESALKHIDSMISKFPDSTKKNDYLLYIPSYYDKNDDCKQGHQYL